MHRVVTTLDDSEFINLHFVYTISTTYMLSHSPSALLSSNVVSAAAEWDWSERLPGMGCKYNFLIIRLKLLGMISNLMPYAE